MASNDTSAFGKFVVGLCVGIGITYAYVRVGYKPPAVVRLANTVTSEASVATAELTLYSPTATDAERHRAMAIVLGNRPELLIDVNNELRGSVLAEVLRYKALRGAKLLKQQAGAYSRALAQPAVRRRLEAKHGVRETGPLKRRMLAAAIRKDEFLSWYLQRFTREDNDERFVDIVMSSYTNELRPARIAEASASQGKFRR